MKEYIELFIEATKRLRFGAHIMTPANYLLKVVELKLKQGGGPVRGEGRLTEDELKAMKKIIDGHMGNTLSIGVETFMGEEILRDWLNTERGDQEARRYCLVNGLIPYSEELVRGLDFYLNAKHLPWKMVKDILEKSKDLDLDGALDEEHEVNQLKVWPSKLDGVWMEDGRVVGVKTIVKMRIEVERTFNLSLEPHLEDEDNAEDEAT